jgi:hypothetical protein
VELIYFSLFLFAQHVLQGKEFESLLPDPLKGTGVVVAGAKATGP